MNSDRIVLDCTLRDGGYYTNWHFPSAMVREYLAVCAGVGVDVIELGYARFHPRDHGPYGRLPEGLLPELRTALPEGHGLRFAAMVDATDLKDLPQEKTGPLLREKLDASCLPVSLVRLAVHYSEAAEIAAAADSLRENGYGVCVNLMQIDLATEEEAAACASTVAQMGPLEAVYLGDSLGSLLPQRTPRLVRRFAEETGNPVGIHAHENQGFALHNTLVAAESGATWLDATMHGMGRGAGNTRTEQLLVALGTPHGDLHPLQELIARHFHPLMERYRWGANALYALAGAHHVHPTYVQRLEERLGRDNEAKLQALRFLSGVPSSSFTPPLLESAEHSAVR